MEKKRLASAIEEAVEKCDGEFGEDNSLLIDALRASLDNRSVLDKVEAFVDFLEPDLTDAEVHPELQSILLTGTAEEKTQAILKFFQDEQRILAEQEQQILN